MHAVDLTLPTEPTPWRMALADLTRAPETALLPALVEQARLRPDQQAAVQAEARRQAAAVRAAGPRHGHAGRVQALLQEFALSSQEGVALMCLAEALLRIPDDATRDALIRDKLGARAGACWQRHLGHSPSLFVNAAAWGLVLTGRLVSAHSEQGLTASLERLLARGGESLIRRGVDLAMRLLGEQFVTGQTIEEALARSAERETRGFRHSYDMLGEAALSDAEAGRYLAAYEGAIEAIGAAAAGRGPIAGPGISIKLSALHPRFVRAQVERVHAELYPRLLHLARRARHHDIGLNLDAEEADRLELSLDLLERLCHEPALAGWQGLGVVVQAYQKRGPAAVDAVIALARGSGRRVMVRLVKGAYWDSEIKRAQLDGLDDYPVYTRKAYTDVAYLACARRLLTAPDAVFPQFATHNAHTCAAISVLAEALLGSPYRPEHYEFQGLHGMGEPLYEQWVPTRPCRIYAPVGSHETLLAYLVRRLLENGANTSFVHRIADPAVPLDDLVRDPFDLVEGWARDEGRLGLPHPAIVLPRALHGDARWGARGLDLADRNALAQLQSSFDDEAHREHGAEPIRARGPRSEGDDGRTAVLNPADPSDRVGWAREATPTDCEEALADAVEGAAHWAAVPPVDRARCLDAAAQALEDRLVTLVPLLVREAGKTCANAVAEVREAVDFLRHDAAQLRAGFDPVTHRPLGVVLCISPWNFPLAIFLGQVAAALAAGNAVLAKPAEQTPLIAAVAVHLLHDAGVPRAALQLLPGRGETVGAKLAADARVQGVLFTGSTEVARLLQRSLARRLDRHGRPVTLVAETGGQNALIVDSSALLEQAVGDILTSAFDSAGQRCSALRLLCVQDDVADRLLTLLRGALEALQVGDPRRLSTDVGPVIDAAAARTLEAHVTGLREAGLKTWRLTLDPAATAAGHFVAPTLIEIDRIDRLEREVFGPVLHVLRWRREQLPQLLAAIRDTGYGLTQGVHSRIDETVAEVVAGARAGNLYVNRNLVGAVVGVQPFGGEGLSGTGPKAGGPLYLLRLLSACPMDAARLAVVRCARPDPVGAAALARLRWGRSTSRGDHPPAARALADLRAWALGSGLVELAQACESFAAATPVCDWQVLHGPTGQVDAYAVRPRRSVLCLAAVDAAGDADRLVQLAAVLAVGARAVWPAEASGLWQRLPRAVQAWIDPVASAGALTVDVDVVIQHGTAADLRVTAERLADRPGPLCGLVGLMPGETAVPLQRLVVERSVSINTAAAGGNASLMTLD